MRKPVYKSNFQGQISLFPARLDQNIAAGSPVRLVNQIVENLDITAIEKTYSGGGTSAYHPRMMLKVLFYAYMNNIYSCRKIGKRRKCPLHVAFGQSAARFQDHQQLSFTTFERYDQSSVYAGSVDAGRNGVHQFADSLH